MPQYQVEQRSLYFCRKKLEGCRGLELCRSITGKDGASGQRELLRRRARGEIHVGQVHPEHIRAANGFKEVAPVLVIRHRAPDRRGDVGLSGRGDTQRHGHVSNHREGAGDGFSCCLTVFGIALM